MNDNVLRKYSERLQSISPPGGNGCHLDLLGVANLGVISGLDAQTIHDNIRNSIPPGKRRVSDMEIDDAIRKALTDHNGQKVIPFIKKSKPQFDGTKARTNIITKGSMGEADLFDLSPVRISWGPEEDAVRFLETIFQPADKLFIGERETPGVIGENIRTRDEWINFFNAGGSAGPLIIINPLSGKEGKTKDGKGSCRCDDAVQSYRHCLVEFDNLSMEDQVRFWCNIKLPVKALIHTGGKSIHAWVDVSKLTKVDTPDEWQSNIKIRLYEEILKPMGVDGACSNPTRLSRLPGCLRQETKQYQKLLWLSVEGRGVIG